MLSQIPCESHGQRGQSSGPSSAKEELGTMFTKHTDRTGHLGIQSTLLITRMLPSNSEYDLVIFLESSKAFPLSSSFLTLALPHHILKTDIWFLVFFSNHKIVFTVIYISNGVPKMRSQLHMSQSLFFNF